MPQMLTLAKKVLFSLLLFNTSCLAVFNIKPTTFDIPVSLLSSHRSAPFYCQYESVHNNDMFFIRWEVNNRSLSNVSDTAITETRSPLPYLAELRTLSLPATLKYNGSRIQCIILFTDGSPIEVSEPPAYFYIVQDGNATTLQTGFSQEPVFHDSKYILAESEVAVLSCQHCDTNVINWRLNGTQIQYANGHVIRDHDGINISYTVQHFCGLTVQLTITNLSAYNDTTIDCAAGNTEDRVGVTRSFILLVQGVLGSVSNLRRLQLEQRDIMYMWNPPFTLNLTNSDPDIAYCVRLEPASCHMNGVTPIDAVCDAFQQCNVTEPWFTVSNCEDVDVLNNIQVIPRNNVEGARNGTPEKHTDEFEVYDDIAVAYVINIATNQRIQVKISLDLQNHRTRVQPTNIMLSLITISSQSQEIITCTTESDTILPSVAERYRSLDVLTCSSRSVHETSGLYMANMYVPNMNCSVSNQSEISTHVLQNIITNTTSESGEIVVSGDFIDAALPDNATATGFIAIAYNIESEDNIKHYYGIAPRHHTQQHVEGRISGLSKGNYRVSVFSLQHNGLPCNESAATAQRISNILPSTYVDSSITNSTDSSIIVNATRTNNDDCIGVKLDCTIMETANDEDQCVAFVLERSQMVSKYGLLDFSIHIFMMNQSDNSSTSSVCLPKQINISTEIIDVFLLRDQRITGVPTTLLEIHDSEQDLPMQKPMDTNKTILILSVVFSVLAVIFIIILLLHGIFLAIVIWKFKDGHIGKWFPSRSRIVCENHDRLEMTEKANS